MLSEETIAFLAVVEHGGFTAAAKALQVPKTNISRHIRRLEAHLGQRLLDRTTRTVALTEAGRVYRDRVAAIPGLIEEGVEAVAALGDEPAGWLRITMPHSLAEGIVSPLIAEFGTLYPAVRFDLLLGHAVRDLVRERIDIALRLGPLSDGDLIARRLSRLVNRVYAAPAYLDRYGTPHSVEDLRHHRILADRMSERGGRYAWSLNDGSGLRDVPVEPLMIADDPGALLPVLAAGEGLMLSTDLVVGRLIATGAVVPVLPGWVGRSPELHAVFPAGRAKLAKVRLFVDFLAERIGAVSSPG